MTAEARGSLTQGSDGTLHRGRRSSQTLFGSVRPVEDDLRSEKIDRKAYDKLGNLRQKGEDEYKRCFTQNAPRQASLAQATLQAERLLAAALNKR